MAAIARRRCKPTVPRSGALALALGVGVSSSWLGCGAAELPVPLPRVEALFDTPGEYRILSTLPCAQGVGLVYVVSSQGELISFNPEALEFSLIGRLDCPSRYGATPNSMAVDRSGTAWLNYTDGSLWRASTRDASCEPSGYRSGQRGFDVVGMAFASTGPELIGETLFFWGGHQWRQEYAPPEDDDPEASSGPRAGLGLAAVDTSRLVLRQVGDDPEGIGDVRGELTGTGDGKLYGFFATVPATLAEVDLRTGATLRPRVLSNVHTGHAWAFSSWGGNFYFYTSSNGYSSDVSRLSGQDEVAQVVLADIGFVIVGAGVSTCAPTGP